MATVVAIGTLDTKGTEYAYLRERLREHGVDVLLVDAGILGEPATEPDVTREEVARAAGADFAQLAAAGDRGAAVKAMAEGSAAVIQRLHNEGRLDAVVGMGGTGGTSLVTHAIQRLPVGVPKLVISTVASGDTRPYVGAVDITMMYSVVDVAGINQISARIIGNAAGAIAGMAKATVHELDSTKPLIGASMFGVTTPCVTTGRERLEELGYEVLVFHQTGTGGQSMEELVKAGFITGVLDVTTTELCDELVGGVLPAHPERLQVAGAMGVPQVVSLGALDMVNFGPMDSVPERFRERRLYVHNPSVTLMRTTPEESAELGRRLAGKLNSAKGPTALFIPLRGISMIATEGQPFHAPASDEALISAVRQHLGSNIEVHELDTDINDPTFALAMANRLHEMVQEANG
jgi:uncharacterized protein (UPF0261 family)